MPVKSKTNTGQYIGSKHEKNGSSSSNTRAEEKESSKPKLVIVNDRKSAFTNIVRPSTSHEGQDERESSSNQGRPKKESSLKLKKRRSVIYDSESDCEDLDFGSDNKSKNKKLKKSVSVPCGKAGFLKKTLNKQVSDSLEVLPVLIDSDTEMNGEVSLNGEDSVVGGSKGSNSHTEEDKEIPVCLIESDIDFE